MPVINFDKTTRRDAKEPQISKTELLRPPQPWNFDVLSTPPPRTGSLDVTAKQESSSPGNLMGSQKRPSDTNETHDPTSKRAKSDDHIRSNQDLSGTSYGDSYGRGTGVVDLTGDGSDEDQDTAMPERQFVPPAEYDSNANHFKRRKAPTPPRTFTRGLSPIAAHPKKAPLVARSKPPIKPRSNRQSSMSSTPTPASHSVFSPRLRPSASLTDGLHLPRQQTTNPPVRPLECTPLGETTDSADQTPATSTRFSPYTQPKASGPFLEEDSDSDGTSGANEDNASKKSRSRETDSLSRLVGRPRNDTPARAQNESLVEKSIQMRQQAREKTQSAASALSQGTTTPTAFRTPGPQSFLDHPHQREAQ